MVQQFKPARAISRAFRLFACALSLALCVFIVMPDGMAATKTKVTPSKQKATKVSAKKKTSSKKKASIQRPQKLNLAEQPLEKSREDWRARGIYSPYGWRSLRGKNKRFHKGVDISAPAGSGIQAYDGGSVIFSGRQQGFGICVFLDHGNGIVSRYAHMSSTALKTGDNIGRGDEVGKVGRTGRTTGAHLHFELLRDGRHLDPGNYVNDARELVLAADMGPGATQFAGIPERKHRSAGFTAVAVSAETAPLTAATVEASKKFTEQSRLGLPSGYSSPATRNANGNL